MTIVMDGRSDLKKRVIFKGKKNLTEYEKLFQCRFKKAHISLKSPSLVSLETFP